MSSCPDTPGKKYLLPPEKPTTSWGNTGPTTIATSASATCRLIRTSTGVPKATSTVTWRARPASASLAARRSSESGQKLVPARVALVVMGSASPFADVATSTVHHLDSEPQDHR